MNKKYTLGIIAVFALLTIAAIPNTIETNDDIYTIHFTGELTEKWVNNDGEYRIDITDDDGTYYAYEVTEEQYEEMTIGEEYLYIALFGSVVFEV